MTVTFRRRGEQLGEELTHTVYRLAWDSNEASLDAFNPRLGWVRVDLSKAYHFHRVYELKRKRLQRIASRKPSLRKSKFAKYSARERNRVRDIIHKETSKISKKFPAVQHFFENMDKERMFTHVRSHNRRLAKSDWKTFQALLAYKTGKPIGFLNPYNSTRRCSKCGGISEAPNGAPVVECRRCGLRIDRQLNAAINLYLQMEGLSPSPRLFTELMMMMRGRSGFAQTGEEADELPDELAREARLMNPQSYEHLRMTT